ncbi:MAG: orotidine-5'-phosphate decarboxylase [Solitalea-like symbiont of Acarus siro]
MKLNKLFAEIKRKKSFLSVGLDTNIDKIPKHLLKYEDPIFEFNKRIIEATAEFCVSYKFNTAFYEDNYEFAWQSLTNTVKWLPKNFFNIADAKRGDIANTAQMYAKVFLGNKDSDLNFNAITLSPYMGSDSIEPFLSYKNKYAIMVALSSNSGNKDFQLKKMQNGDYLFEEVIKTALGWSGADRIMFVVGATQAKYLEKVRKAAPNSFLLVPGIGAQGGSLEEVAKNGLTKQCGLLVAISRSIIYASDKEDFAEKAAIKAKEYQKTMAVMLDKYLK